MEALIWKVQEISINQVWQEHSRVSVNAYVIAMLDKNKYNNKNDQKNHIKVRLHMGWLSVKAKQNVCL